MMPFSVICNYCQYETPEGKRFNSVKELIKEENYLKVEIYRFYIRCFKCNKRFTVKTDPKNKCYTIDRGCTKVERSLIDKDTHINVNNEKYNLHSDDINRNIEYNEKQVEQEKKRILKEFYEKKKKAMKNKE